MKNMWIAIAFLAGLVLAESGLVGQEVYQLGGGDRVDAYEGKIDGYSIRHRWRELQPAPGTFDWRWLDSEVDRAQEAGLKVMIRIMAGVDSPEWAVDATLTDNRGKLPDPRTELHREAALQMLAAVGARYRDRADYFHVSAFGNGGETNRPKGSDDLELSRVLVERALTLAEAVSPGDMPAGARRCIINHADPNAGWVKGYREMLADLDVPITLQMNALAAKTNTDWVGFTTIRDWRPQDRFARGFQMLSRSSASRFGGDLPEALAKGALASPFYYEVYRGGDTILAAELLEPLEPEIDPAEVKRLADLIRNDSYAKSLSPDLYTKLVDQVAEEAKKP